MVNLFGNKDALIGSLDLLFGALYVLVAFILVKSITDWSIKIPFAIGLGVWVAAGFLLATPIGDGWAGGKE